MYIDEGVFIPFLVRNCFPTEEEEGDLADVDAWEFPDFKYGDTCHVWQNYGLGKNHAEVERLLRGTLSPLAFLGHIRVEDRVAEEPE